MLLSASGVGFRATVMTGLQNKLNDLSDKDWGWWPLLSIRPKKDERMTSGLLLKLTAVVGSCSGAWAATVIHLRHNDVSLRATMLIVMLSWLFFYLTYRFTFARAWNARAAELNRRAA